MANETTTTTANDTVVTVLHRALLEEARPLVLPFKSWYIQCDPFVTGRVVQIPQVTDPGAAAAINEATDAANTAIGTDPFTITATEQAIMATPTDVLSEASPFDPMNWVRDVLGRSLAERLNDQFAGLLPNYSNTTGVSGSDFTLAQFIAAVGALSGRDARGPYRGCFHPQQVLDLRSGSGNTPGGIIPADTTTATYYARDYLSNPNFNESVMESLQREAYAGQLLGVDIWQTSSVVTANNGADRAGAIFAEEAGAWHQIRDFRVESQRDASLRATELVASYNLGVGEVIDAFGQSVVTDA